MGKVELDEVVIDTERDNFGVYSVIVNKGAKSYSYRVASEFAVRSINRCFRFKRYNAGFKLIEQFRIREE